MPCPPFEHPAGGFFDGAGENKCFCVYLVYDVAQAPYFQAGDDGKDDVDGLAYIKAVF